MSKIVMMKCDICEAVYDEHTGFVMEIRPDLDQGQSGEVEKWDMCPDCKRTMKSFFQSRKESDIPILPNVNTSVFAPEHSGESLTNGKLMGPLV